MSEIILSKKAQFTVLLIGLLFTPVCSLAAYITINPTDDTYVDEFTPSDNYGASVELNVGIKDKAAMTNRCRTFLKFDLSSIPMHAYSVITYAILEMEVTSYDSTMPPTDVAVHNVYPVFWDEMTLDWSMPPNVSAAFCSVPTFTVTIGGTGIFSWVVTSDVITAFNSLGTYSALVKVVDDKWIPGQTDFVQLRAKESGTPAKLIITYSPPNLEPANPAVTGNIKAMVIKEKLESHKDTTDLIYVEDDPQGNPTHVTHIGGDPCHYLVTEKMEITYADHSLIGFRPTQIQVAWEPNGIKTIADSNYDILGRFQHGSSNPYGSATDQPTEIDLSYDVWGNLNTAGLSYADGSSISWTLGFDPNDNIFKRTYEKKDNTSGTPIFTGMIDYFLCNYNEKQLLFKTVQGDSGAAKLYNYDTADRLTSITRDNGTYLREYLYNADGMLEEYSNHENDAYNSALNYTYDLRSGLLTEITSATNSAAPNHTFLGKLSLSYYDNGTLHEVGYSTDEMYPPDPVQPVFSTNYAYDDRDRLIKAEYISRDANVPDIIVIMDPCSPTGDYMLTQYIYDNFGRLAWTVDTCGYVTRTIYNQAPGLEEKEMLQIRIEGPQELYLTSFEHSATDYIIRSTDLQGHFTQYEYDGNGNQFNSYVLGTHGGIGGGAYGQVLKMFAYANFFPPDPCLRFEWDQYGDLGVVLEEGKVGMNGEGVGNEEVKKKLSRNKKTTKQKPAKDKRKGCTESVKGDCNVDCKVNFLDLACVAQNWLLDKTSSTE